MKNVVIYIRVSTPKQKKEGESLEDQAKSIREFCKTYNYKVIKVFSDDFTGTTSQRPGILEMYNYLEINKDLLDIQYCIIRHIDRSSRGGIKVYEEIKDKLSSFGVQLKDTYGIIQEKRKVIGDIGDVKLEYDFCYSEPSKSSEAMMAIISEEERKQILRRTIPREIALEQEGYQVRLPNYGFENKKISTDKGKRVIQVERHIEGAWVKEMFKERAKGVETDTEIVRKLVLKGCKKRSGKDMEDKQMQRILSNPIYAGVRISKWTGNKPIKTKYKGLVSINLWNQANKGKAQLIEGKNNTVSIIYYQGEIEKAIPFKIKRKNYNPEYPYSKVLMCPDCKGELTANTSTSGNGSLHYYYQCRGKNRIKHRTYTLKRETTHNSILNIFKSIKIDDTGLSIFDDTVNEVFKEMEKEKVQDVLSYEDHIKELDKKTEKILSDIGKVIDFPIILESKNRELETIKSEKLNLLSAKQNSKKISKLEHFKEYAKDIITHLDKLAQQSQHPKYIKLAFEVIFGGKIEFEKLNYHTSNLPALIPILSQQKNSSNDEFGEKDKWGALRGSNP